jgi:hypothetical protein
MKAVVASAAVFSAVRRVNPERIEILPSEWPFPFVV